MFRLSASDRFAALLSILSAVAGVFLVMAAGAVARRAGWLTAEADVTLARLTANILLPAFFVSVVAQDENLDSLGDTWVPPTIGFAFTAGGFLLGWAVAKTFGGVIGLPTESHRRAFALCVGVANYGYVPFPLAEAFYPAAKLDLVLHNVGVDVALWSVGIIVIAGSEASDRWASLRSALLSAPLISVVVSLVLRRVGVLDQLPTPIIAAIDSLGVCAIPLGLLLSGAIIVDFVLTRRSRPESGGAWRTIAAAVVIRQVVLPAFMLGLAVGVVLPGELDVVLLLQASMPAAIFPVVLVRMYARDVDTALRVVLGTSAVGLLSIPLVLALGASLGIGTSP